MNNNNNNNDGKCIAFTSSGSRCRFTAKHADPAVPNGPLLVCGTHYKKIAEHIKKLAETRQRQPLIVNPGGNDNNAPAAGAGPVVAGPDAGKKDDDEMTEEDLRADRRSSLPGESKTATEGTVDTGASKERWVDTVKIDNSFYVCNVTGSSRDKGAWKTFWEKRVGSTQPARCQIKYCEKQVGATGHMYWRDDKDGKVYNYLIPICSHHNGAEYDWTGDEKTTKWQQCKRGVAVKIKENPRARTHGYNLRQRKKK